jgi:hypothetical protein
MLTFEKICHTGKALETSRAVLSTLNKFLSGGGRVLRKTFYRHLSEHKQSQPKDSRQLSLVSGYKCQLKVPLSAIDRALSVQ